MSSVESRNDDDDSNAREDFEAKKTVKFATVTPPAKKILKKASQPRRPTNQ